MTFKNEYPSTELILPDDVILEAGRLRFSSFDWLYRQTPHFEADSQKHQPADWTGIRDLSFQNLFFSKTD